MSEVRIPACYKADRLAYALLGATALAVFVAGAVHEIKKPESGLLVTLITVVLMLGSAILCFMWATASVGITEEQITQYYFGFGFRRVRFAEVESAFVEPWGFRYPGIITGRGPYLIIILKTKTGRRVAFEGLKALAEPSFTRIAERYAARAQTKRSPNA